MKRGKTKKAQKKYFSIVLVPHSSSNVKVLKFKTSFYAKLITCFVVLIAIFVCGGLYISRMLDENSSLKQDIHDLYSTTTEQNKLLDAKSAEINRLENESVAFKDIVNDKIEKFTDDFNKITDEYLEERTQMANRSGERTETAFTDDMRNLKTSLDSLTQLYSRTNRPNGDLDAAEAKINEFMKTIPTLWPTSGTITDRFGNRKDPFTKKIKFHTGLDIATDYGKSIKASASGKVIVVDEFYGTGKTVKIDHGKGITTVYGHCSKILVKEGQIVEKGEVIAKVGSSGRSTGPHLHLEIQLYGTPVNPLEYLQ